MIISLSWLAEWVDISATATDIEHKLSISGLEVEHIHHWSNTTSSLKNFVIGEVLTVQKHPNADKLSLTTVNVGKEQPYAIVCGAPNVAAGQQVVVALPGAEVTVPGKGTFTIKESKIRGEVSNGMICAEDELGFGSNHDGILVLPQNAPIGASASDYFEIVSETLLEIGLTANRGDAASHKGVARDLAALFKTPLKSKNPSLPYKPTQNPNLFIERENEQECLSYYAIGISNVLVSESPDWLKNRLKSLGITPINNVVDATNYILHDCGQPLHAFDAKAIENKISIRRAYEGEKLITLDKIERTLSPQDLVIANHNSVIALAGVLGGLESGVTANTTSIILESAEFSPSRVRKTAKNHGLSTDASFRFERGIDASQLEEAGLRCAALIAELSGGRISFINTSANDPLPKKTIKITSSYIQQLSGTSIPENTIEDILSYLSFELSRLPNENAWEVKVPYHRNDIEGKADLVEEILRIYGYDQVPFPGTMNLSLSTFKGIQQYKKENTLRDILVAKGCIEVMNNSLTPPDWHLNIPENQWVKISNPLSNEHSVMRPQMLPSLLQSVSYNLNRQQDRLKLFEFGKIYLPKENAFHEKSCLSIVFCGNTFPESWEPLKREADFYAIKALVSELLEALNSQSTGWNNTVIEQAPLELCKKFDIDKPLWFANLYLDELYKVSNSRKFILQDVPKFPVMRRDLSIVVDENVQFEEIKKEIDGLNISLLKEFKVFDVYKGKPLEANTKAIAMAYYFSHPERTLNDADAETLISKISDALTSKLGAYIRK